MMELEKGIRGQDGSQEKKAVPHHQHKGNTGGGLYAFACAYVYVCAFMCECMHGQMEVGPASSASSQDPCAQMPSRASPQT